MKLITRQSLSNEVCESWVKQYPNSHKDILYKLSELGTNKDPDKVDEIIGNNSWTNAPTCNECGKDGVDVAQIGEDPDYDSSTTYICKKCLLKAIKLFDTIN